MTTNIEMETLTAIKSAARKFTSNEIDWEQRRYEIAKDVIPSLLSRQYITKCGYVYDIDEVQTTAIRIADNLIQELKNEPNNNNSKN